MWDQNSSNDSQSISVSGTAGTTTTTTAAGDNKQIFQSNLDQDSGFLSGPISNQFSSEIDDDADITDPTPPPSHQQQQQQPPRKAQESYTDSGAIDDFIDDEDDGDKKQEQSHKMILDSGVDLGLEEWFCCMNLKNSTQPLNNLGATANTYHKAMLEAAAVQQRFPKISSKLQQQQTPLWEICYIQDDDGDT